MIRSMMMNAAPADVLAVCTGTGWAQKLIDIGAVLRGEATPANHVIVVTHQDVQGRWIGIQGQPGGVGPADCTPFLRDPRTRSNHDQPRPAPFTAWFLASYAKTLGISYDWAGIAMDGLDDLGLADLSAVIAPLWQWPSRSGQLPGHVVCSSLAAMLYTMKDVPNPGLKNARTCQPADWWEWNDGEKWLSQH